MKKKKSKGVKSPKKVLLKKKKKNGVRILSGT